MSKKKKPPSDHTIIGEIINRFLFAIPIISCFLWTIFVNHPKIWFQYLIVASSINIPLYILEKAFKKWLFWVFFPQLISFFSYVIGFLLLTIAFLDSTLGKMYSFEFYFLLSFGISTIYLITALPFFFNDYKRKTKERLSSFDFDIGTYDLSRHSLLGMNIYADFYAKSILSKIHMVVIKATFFGSISGAVIGIIAGKISGSFQMGVGLFATILTDIFLLQIAAPLMQVVYRIIELQIKHKKWFTTVGEIQE
jgi:hypothetical protein